MNELQNYVDALFRHQPETPETQELKEEVLSNMTARKNDLMARGMSEGAATQKAKESLASIDSLVDGSQLTYVDRYHAQCLQSALLCSLIFWICSLPLLFVGYILSVYLGFEASVIFGLFYLIDKRRQADAIAFISVSASQKRQKIVWIIWILFFVIYTGAMAALTFGSNLWFGRPVAITGPYQMASIAARFYLPLITIAIPIAFNSFTKILIKNEKR